MAGVFYLCIMLVTEKAQWIYLAKVRLTQLVEAYKLRAASVLIVCIECLETANTTEAQAEKILTYIVQEYCLDEVPVPIIIPNIPYLPVPTYGAGKDGRAIINTAIISNDLILYFDQYPFSENVGRVVGTNGTNGRGITSVAIIDGDLILYFNQAPIEENVGQVVPTLSFLDLTDTPDSYTGQGGKAVAVKDSEDGLKFVNFPATSFPTGTPNVNVAVGGWFAGYVLAGKEVIASLIDLGVQFINPSTTLSFTSLVQSTSLAVSGNNIERGAIITAINVNRVRNLGSDTFTSGLYTQPNLSDVNDNAGTPNARSFTGASITASNTAISGGIPVHTITLLTDYGTSPNETDTLNINFVSPVYFGVLPVADTTNPASIQGLGKASLANNQFRTGLSFTPSSNRIVYAYPSRFANLTNITDGNNFAALPNFNSPITVNLTFPNAPSETYKVYVYSIDISPSTVIFNFNA